MKDDIVKFLLGEAPMDGIWFGEKHPTAPNPNFWWRKHLRDAITSCETLQLALETEQIAAHRAAGELPSSQMVTPYISQEQFNRTFPEVSVTHEGESVMKMWIDTEFNEYKGALISLALVAENGSEWYGVRYCDDPGDWVGEHVMPYLFEEPQRDTSLRISLHEFLSKFDSVHIVADWPGDIAHFCNFLEYRPGDRIGPDRMLFEVRRDLPDTATTSAVPHNALEDARALARGDLTPQINPDQQEKTK